MPHRLQSRSHDHPSVGGREGGREGEGGREEGGREGEGGKTNHHNHSMDIATHRVC